MSKIIARVCGGLGNQLFIYAAARRISLINELSLKLDIISGFKSDTQYRRNCLLHQFNINGEIASKKESYEFAGGRLLRYLVRRINKFIRFENRFYISEQSPFCFDDRVLSLKPKKSIYMEGYWHSEKYFKDIEWVIRNDFKIIADHEPIAMQEAQKIKAMKNPVCIGIRLFQEAVKPGIHRVLSKKYYRKAVEIVSREVENPHFFIFCNDNNFVLQLPYDHTHIKPKPENERAYEDLWLMSLCRHFIISNSSYHWWGAWLSDNKEKIVIAPKNGFYNQDIIPNGWIASDLY